MDGEIHSLGVYDTLTDAKAALAIAQAEKVRGTFVPPARLRAARRVEVEQVERESVTLARWAEQWLEHLRDQGGAESSIVTHRSVLRAHVLPVLGQVRLIDIAPSDVDELIAGVRARPSARNPKARVNGVAPNVLRTLRACLNVAVKRGLLAVSPVRAEAPARRVRPIDPEGDVATPAEIAAMAEAMPDYLRIAIPLASWCSLRLGEVLGLQGSDLQHLDDPDHAVLHVRRQVNSKAPGAPLTPPKAESIRSIALVLDALVGNSDRHPGNWALLESETGDRFLAPTYDHGSALGAGMTDANRTVKDPKVFARKGKANAFTPRKQSLVDLAHNAVCRAGAPAWLERVYALDTATMRSILEAPKGRLSVVAATFMECIVLENRRRLCDDDSAQD
ncbi:tyrosine recombinase XerC [Occultella kanbiaonis]|uniref:site-specific integrase n=1 Tax=Occultella kanbiaonis TaxID=2675754 RepID=UPI0013CFDBC1|nr:hypothetical protein [Occultella kanbiaonis]